MAEQLQIPLPMWRVQYQLLGGSRRIFGTLAISLTVLIVAVAGIRRLFMQESFGVICDWALYFLGPIQCVVLVLGGCNAVYRALLRDYESRMIESHRLTPMSNLAVVLGYLFGATLQILPLWATLFLCGFVFSKLASTLTVMPWIAGNLSILNGAITLWSAVIFFGMRPEKPFNPSGVLIGAASLTVPLALLPGAGILVSVYPILLGIWIMNGRIPVSREAMLTIAFINLGFTLFWILAAATKYRRPDLPALNGVRGLVLLLVAMVVSTVGIVAFERATAGFGRRQMNLPDGSAGQWIATMIGGLLLAAVPIAGAVRCRVLGTRGTALRGWGDRVNPGLVALLGAALVCGVMATLGVTVWRDIFPQFLEEQRRSSLIGSAWLHSAAACVVGTLSLMLIFQIGYSMMRSPKFLVLLFLVLLWAVPPLVDFARATYVQEELGKKEMVFSWLMGCSPPGTIMAVWFGCEFSLIPGLIAQVAICIVLAVIARQCRPRQAAAIPTEA